MLKKILILSTMMCVAFSFGARAADLADSRECRGGTVYVNGHAALDSAGKAVPCGQPAAAYADPGVDPALLGLGAVVVVGAGVGIALATRHHSSPASP